MALFDSEETKIRKSHIRNLIAIAITDGHFDEHEKELLLNIAARSGLKPDEFKDMLDNPQEVKFHPPNTKEERAQQLLDSVLMMMIDGKIQEKEMGFCKILAPALGYPPSLVDKVVDVIIEGINQKIKTDELVKRVADIS